MAMLNEIHLRMGYELVYKLKLEMLAVDKIAEKYITKAFHDGMKAAPVKLIEVDCIGLALELEAQSNHVESQTVERAMLAAANGFRSICANC